MLLKKLWAFAQNTFKEMKSMKRLWDDEEPTMNDEKKGNGHPLNLNAIFKSSHTCPPQCINDQPWCTWDFFMALKYVFRS